MLLVLSHVYSPFNCQKSICYAEIKTIEYCPSIIYVTDLHNGSGDVVSNVNTLVTDTVVHFLFATDVDYDERHSVYSPDIWGSMRRG